jgi:hypothetical protein
MKSGWRYGPSDHQNYVIGVRIEAEYQFWDPIRMRNFLKGRAYMESEYGFLGFAVFP